MFYLADGRKFLYQWDLDRRVIASDDELTELHFYYTSEETLIVEKKSDDNIGDYFEIPNILLQSSGGIRFYGCVEDYTKEVGQFNVTARPKPADYVYTETEVKRWEDTEKRANDVLDAANKAVNAANKTLDTTIAELNNYDISITNHEKRITNLERHINNDYFVTDDTIAYIKTVPADVCPYAEVQKIGCCEMRKSTNLLKPFSRESTTQKGITVTIGNDGIRVDGRPTGMVHKKIFDGTLEAGTYVINGIAGASNKTYQLAFDINEGTAKYISDTEKTFTLTEAAKVRIWFYVYKGAGKLDNKLFQYAINQGEDVLPYEAFYGGFYSNPVTELVSIGVNLFDYNSSIAKKFRFNVIPNATLYRNTTLHDMKKWTVYDKENRSLGTFQDFNFTASNPLKLPADAAYIEEDDYADNNCYIGYDSNNTYRPYFKRTLTIPDEICRSYYINENVYDYIEWREDGTIWIHENVDVVDMGTLDWKISNYGNNIFEARGFNRKYTKSDCICSLYPTVNTSLADINIDKSITMPTNDYYVFVKDSDYTDAAAFKTAMSGVMLYYETEYPFVIDFPNIILDNFIGVEAGGTITAVNEYRHNAPSEITYLLKEGSI